MNNWICDGFFSGDDADALLAAIDAPNDRYYDGPGPVPEYALSEECATWDTVLGFGVGGPDYYYSGHYGAYMTEGDELYWERDYLLAFVQGCFSL